MKITPIRELQYEMAKERKKRAFEKYKSLCNKKASAEEKVATFKEYLVANKRVLDIKI